MRAFRVGTNQAMYGSNAQVATAGSVFDDGVDIANGQFVQNSAFTANIVGSHTVQIVKGPAHSSGVLTGIGKWSSGATYVSYGDLTIVSERIALIFVGYVGGLIFPFTGGGFRLLQGVYPDHPGIVHDHQSGGDAPTDRSHGGGWRDRRCRPVSSHDWQRPGWLGRRLNLHGDTNGWDRFLSWWQLRFDATIPLAPTEGLRRHRDLQHRLEYAYGHVLVR